MTHTTQDYDAWTEAAYEYIRDALRTSTTIGLNGSLGVRSIEIGKPSLDIIARNPESLPSLWLIPNGDTVRPVDLGTIEVTTHKLQLTLACLSMTPAVTQAEFVDAQKEHRQLAGRAYNALMGLNEAGRTAGHWREFEPAGSTPHDATFPTGIIMGTTLRFVLTAKDKIWITET